MSLALINAAAAPSQEDRKCIRIWVRWKTLPQRPTGLRVGEQLDMGDRSIPFALYPPGLARGVPRGLARGVENISPVGEASRALVRVAFGSTPMRQDGKG
jgi:hypothetical protein